MSRRSRLASPPVSRFGRSSRPASASAPEPKRRRRWSPDGSPTRRSFASSSRGRRRSATGSTSRTGSKASKMDEPYVVEQHLFCVLAGGVIDTRASALFRLSASRSNRVRPRAPVVAYAYRGWSWLKGRDACRGNATLQRPNAHAPSAVALLARTRRAIRRARSSHNFGAGIRSAVAHRWRCRGRTAPGCPRRGTRAEAARHNAVGCNRRQARRRGSRRRHLEAKPRRVPAPHPPRHQHRCPFGGHPTPKRARTQPRTSSTKNSRVPRTARSKPGENS